jgi:hypothetical protein
MIKQKEAPEGPPEASGYWSFNSCHSWMCTEEDRGATNNPFPPKIQSSHARSLPGDS